MLEHQDRLDHAADEAERRRVHEHPLHREKRMDRVRRADGRDEPVELGLELGKAPPTFSTRADPGRLEGRVSSYSTCRANWAPFCGELPNDR